MRWSFLSSSISVGDTVSSIDNAKIINLLFIRNLNLFDYKSDKINYLGKENKPKCLIIDDTDLPKTGRKMEWIGYIFSHVSGSYMLSFKDLAKKRQKREIAKKEIKIVLVKNVKMNALKVKRI